MVKIKYIGSRSPVRTRGFGFDITWERDEIKNIDSKIVDKLLTNISNFKLVESKKKKVEPKKEEKESDDSILEKVEEDKKW